MTAVAVAAPNDAAAEAGAAVAESGGNAVDAALAACLVAMVNEVGIVSLSSGGFVTVQPGDGSTAQTVDGWMDVPGRSHRARPESTWDISTGYGGGVDITVGPGSVATHGAVAAFEETHRRWGRVPWREIVAPAGAVAADGFRLGPASRFYLDHVHETIFGWHPASREVLHEADGRIPSGVLVVPHLAESLRLIGTEGAAALHTGELARSIAAAVVAGGGRLGRDDLAAYRPVVRPALRAEVGPWDLGTTSPPAVGGLCVATMLRLLDRPGAEGWSVRTVEELVRVQRVVLGHRHRTAERSVVADERVADEGDSVDRDAAALLDRVARTGVALGESGSTAHVSATDAEGTSCAVTVSSGYGSGMVAEGTGIWLNNCLGEQELNPRGPYGRAPGTRLSSNMAPTVGRRDDGASLAIGSPGADRIPTAVVTVLAGFLAGMGLQEAVDHPRVHVHRAGRPDEQVRVEPAESLTMYFGGVGATMVAADGTLAAAADPRRGGAVRLTGSRV